MINLTLSIDEELAKRARIKAIGEGTSLSAKVREFLTSYVQTPAPAASTADPVQELLALMARVRAEAQPEPVDPTAAPQTLREQTYGDGFRHHP